MTGNVVRLSPDPMVWVCACGCSTFELLSDGSAMCAACEADATLDHSGWAEWSGTSLHNADDIFRDIQGNGSVEFSRRRLAQLAADDDAALVVVIKDDGHLSAWSAAETEEQLDWAAKKMDQAKALILRKGEA